MGNTKKISCNKCRESFEYDASEIKYEEQPNGRKDITGGDMTDTIKVVVCPKCGAKKKYMIGWI